MRYVTDPVVRREVRSAIERHFGLDVRASEDGAGLQTSPAGLRSFRRSHPLGGLSIRELIDEGRE